MTKKYVLFTGKYLHNREVKIVAPNPPNKIK